MSHGQPGDKKCSARPHLRSPLRLFSAPSRHWLRPNIIIAAPTLPLLVAAVRHLADQLAVALARDLALVHHQIGTSACPSWSRNEASVVEFFNGPWWRKATRRGHGALHLTKKLVGLIQGKHTLIYGDGVDSFIACASRRDLACQNRVAEWSRAPLWKVRLQKRG